MLITLPVRGRRGSPGNSPEEGMSFDLSTINWLAVIVGTVIYFALGRALVLADAVRQALAAEHRLGSREDAARR